MAKDFRATQVETTKIILSGGIGSQGVGGIIYSGSVATNREGGIPANMLSNVGTDVFLFVSGTKSNSDFNRTDVTLFGGDVVISGTLYAERQVIEVDSVADGDFFVTGNFYARPDVNSDPSFSVVNASNQSLIHVDSAGGSIILNKDAVSVETFIRTAVGAALDVKTNSVIVNEGGSAFMDFRVETDTNTNAIFVDASNDSVSVLGGSAVYPGTDVGFFVSGAIGEKDLASAKSVAAFGGDVVISGTLHGGSPLTVGFDMHLSSSAGSTQYLNFGDAEGVGGYGFRSSAGTMQFRNNGGSWSNFGAGAGGGGSDVDWVDRGNSLVTTSSVSVAGGLGDSFEASNADSRAFTFFSGARAELGTLSAATTGLYAGTQTNVFFGGDVVFSGSLHGKSAVGGGVTLFDATADDINFRKARQFIVANEAGTAPSSGPNYDGNVGFTVTGSIDSRGIPSAISGVALFGGDLVVSGTMHTDHGVQRRFKILTSGSPYAVESNDHHIIVDVNSAFTIDLPRCDVAGAGREIYIKGKDQVSNSNYIDIVAYSGQYIDNAATFRITTPWTSVQLISDGGAGAGATWYIMSDGRV